MCELESIKDCHCFIKLHTLPSSLSTGMIPRMDSNISYLGNFLHFFNNITPINYYIGCLLAVTLDGSVFKRAS